MLKLYWTDADQLQIPPGLPLSAYRIKRLDALKLDKARRCSLCAELLLNEAVSREAAFFPLPLEIKTDVFGKPYLTGHEFEFSLSHSAHYAACALANFPVGLDIQIRINCDERLARRFFTAKEQESIVSANDRDAAFTRLWCRKESYLKAIGTGLRLPLDSFDISGDRPELSNQGITYGFSEFQIDGLFFCVCASAEGLSEHIVPMRLELP